MGAVEHDAELQDSESDLELMSSDEDADQEGGQGEAAKKEKSSEGGNS